MTTLSKEMINKHTPCYHSKGRCDASQGLWTVSITQYVHVHIVQLCTLYMPQKQLHFIRERGVSKRGVGVYCHLVMDSWMPCTRPLERRKGHTICSPSPPLSSPCVIIIICQIQFGGGSGKAGAYSSIFPHFSHQSILLYPHYHSSHHHHRYFPIIIALIIFYIFYLAPFLFGDVLHLKP